MSKPVEPKHKYAYQFGNTDRGILFAVLLGSLFLTGMVAETVFDTALTGGLAQAPDATKVTNGTSDDSGGGTLQAVAPVVIAVGIVLVSECFTITLALIVLTVISYVIYRLLSWVEEKCKNMCKCKWTRPWCCLGKLICWAVTVVKWVALVVTITLAISVIVSFLVCILVAVGIIIL